jgi:hypothetical protein
MLWRVPGRNGTDHTIGPTLPTTREHLPELLLVAAGQCWHLLRGEPGPLQDAFVSGCDPRAPTHA